MVEALTKLQLIQKELQVPKGQYNSYGGFYYRSCEDILEALKPIAAKHECVVYIADEIVKESDRFYIKATVTLVDLKSGETISCTGYAREEATKKGMDGSQLTGTASSYARKYALNGMFMIDDTKDADTGEFAQQQKNAPEEKPIVQSAEVKCPKCGRVMGAKVKADGSIATPEQILEGCGGMCFECYKKQSKK